jgi:hypothetical protein
VLKAHRPNLLLVGLDTHPTGLLVVAGLDPAERALRERYDLIVRAAWDQKDAPPPGDILARAGAIAPCSRLQVAPCSPSGCSERRSRSRMPETTTDVELFGERSIKINDLREKSGSPQCRTARYLAQNALQPAADRAEADRLTD